MTLLCAVWLLYAGKPDKFKKILLLKVAPGTYQGLEDEKNIIGSCHVVGSGYVLKLYWIQLLELQNAQRDPCRA